MLSIIEKISHKSIYKLWITCSKNRPNTSVTHLTFHHYRKPAALMPQQFLTVQRKDEIYLTLTECFIATTELWYPPTPPWFDGSYKPRPQPGGANQHRHKHRVSAYDVCIPIVFV